MFDSLYPIERGTPCQGQYEGGGGALAPDGGCAGVGVRYFGWV